MISEIGISGFVNTLGAILAPVYGVMITDYYLVKKEQVDIQQLFSSDPNGAYYYDNGWNKKAIIAFGLGGIFSISSVWVPALQFLSGYAWLIAADSRKMTDALTIARFELARELRPKMTSLLSEN